jgi:NAD(P)H dehydrogenase (quinone)
MSPTIYAVTGATGHLGQLVITELLQKVPPQQIVAVVRNPKKAKHLYSAGITVRLAKYQDKAALTHALEGVNELLLISSSDMTTSRSEQHCNVIDAAKATGVHRIVYTSILHADTTTNPLAPDHKATEAYLVASGLEYALLRHGWYTENYTRTVETAEQSGVILTSAGQGRVSSASRADYAAADAIVLLDKTPDQIYELAGDASWDFAELTTTASALLAKDLELQNVSSREHVSILKTFGVDASTALLVAGIDASIAAGDLEDNYTRLSAIIGRPTTPFAQGLKRAIAYFS